MSWLSQPLYAGVAQGEVLRFDAPISFWGGINPTNAKVTLAGHPQLGAVITDKILVIPTLIGSSSSSAIILELLYQKIAPKALILGARDAILPIGVLVASQMNWTTMPVLLLDDPPFKTGDQIGINSSGEVYNLDDTQ